MSFRRALSNATRSARFPAGMAAMAATRVTIPDAGEGTKGNKDHWANKDGTLFVNPWPSYRQTTAGEVANMIYEVNIKSGPPEESVAEASKRIPIVKPDFGAGMKKEDIKATWLGHACFLVELPTTSPTATRGVRILFDPVFSHRCSPVSFMGPARFTPPPCTVEQLPEVDAIVISHNHYDHLDIPTLEKLMAVYKDAPTPPLLFLPLNTKYALSAKHLSAFSVHELDWFEARDVDVEGIGAARITCTPAQHFTGRGLTDRMKALWASWAVEGLNETGFSKTPAKVWFAGDTGYCSCPDGTYDVDEKLPVCPAFKDIGTKLGPFDLGLIPIGAYGPRGFMSPIHASPIDSVRIFQDTKCKQALGMHWGAWRLTSEPVDEPPKRLATARTQVGMDNEEFTVCAIGETRAYEVGK